MRTFLEALRSIQESNYKEYKNPNDYNRFWKLSQFEYETILDLKKEKDFEVAFKKKYGEGKDKYEKADFGRMVYGQNKQTGKIEIIASDYDTSD